MDPILWSFLPMALVELVVSRLPFLSLVRMRRVCKSWNFLVLSKGFAPPNPTPKTLLLHLSPVYEDDRNISDKIADIRPSLIAWDMASMSRGFQKTFLNCPQDILDKDIRLPTLAATGGGLLCFDISSPTDPNFIVCNPVTNKWKRLPCIELHTRLLSGLSTQWTVAGLAYNENCKSYKLVVAGFQMMPEGRHMISYLKGTQVYDSVTESWTLTYQHRKMKEDRFSRVYNKSLFWNNHLYVITREGSDFNWHSVAIFSMKMGTWIKVIFPLGTAYNNFDPASLVLSDDQVLLVEEESQGTGTKRSQSFAFWKLDIPDMEALWNPNMLVIPSLDLWLKLKSVNTGESTRFPNWACVGHQNFTSFLFHKSIPKYNPCHFCVFEPSLSASV